MPTKQPKENSVEEIVKEFEKDFREYLTASINHFEVTNRPLSSEDEIKWLKTKLTTILLSFQEKVREEERNRIAQGLSMYCHMTKDTITIHNEYWYKTFFNPPKP